MSFEKTRFQNPPVSYRGAPLWSWNVKIDGDEVVRQIEDFQKMGFSGAHIHVRIGLDTEYLGDEYMRAVKKCVEEAKSRGMYIYLYDEDRWPSGYGGGTVTKNPEFRACHLLFTPVPYEEKQEEGERNLFACFSIGERSGNGILVGCYDVVLDKDGIMTGYRRIARDGQAEGKKWYAYVETNPVHPWYNYQTYVDVLNAEATKDFIQSTHERYRRMVGDEFGKSVPSVFTDEPHMVHKTNLAYADLEQDLFLPWTSDLAKDFQTRRRTNILECLPELFWETKDGSCDRVRYQFHDYLAERFAQNYMGELAKWCRRNQILLTGHLLFEETLESQNKSAGDLMRSYRNMDIPGMDLLMDEINLTTAKQVQSVVRQYGKTGAMSEMYGVNNYDFDFRDYKFQGDWQAALGITFRVPHLSWLSMEGEAKRDYPASFNYQSPWYREFRLVEDHFARVNVVLGEGKAVVRVAVIHPLESYWCRFGPEDMTGQNRKKMDGHFQDLTRWLVTNGLDFDFLDEALLPELCSGSTHGRRVGEMEYEAVLLPELYTVRNSTVDFLNRFYADGGKVFIIGACPVLLDGDKGGVEIKGEVIPFEKEEILQKITPQKEIEFCLPDGTASEKYIYQLRRDKGECGLFIASIEKPADKDVTESERVTIKIRGNYTVRYLDTMTGTVTECGAAYQDGRTCITWNVHPFESLLFLLNACGMEADGPDEKDGMGMPKREWQSVSLPNAVDYELSEPNVLLLDMAEYALDGEEYLPEEEILRIDTRLRLRLGYPLRTAFDAQPYVRRKITEGHCVCLRYHIESEVDVSGVKLALESAEMTEVFWDRAPLGKKTDGWYVDRHIQMIPLPKITSGTHALELKIPFTEKTNLEAAYLVGNFGTRVVGRRAYMTGLPEKLAFQSVTSQRLGFYSANILYKMRVCCPKGRLKIRISKYRGALLGILIDGERKGSVIYPPYEFETHDLEPGEHEVGLLLFGNRYNTFAALHHAADSFKCTSGTMTWRTEKDAWSYEYQLSDFGILKAPEIEV